MKLRKLELKDAELMLEWMHDEDVVANLGTNFKEKKIEDCVRFIELSSYEKEDLHRAIVDENDTYMGTVSLKHIDRINKTAEFAVTVRNVAMGKGFSKFGMSEIIKIGFKEVDLNEIYWCVSRENLRAIRFYDKNEYSRINDVPYNITKNYTLEQQKKFLWYRIKNENNQ